MEQEEQRILDQCDEFKMARINSEFWGFGVKVVVAKKNAQNL